MSIFFGVEKIISTWACWRIYGIYAARFRALASHEPTGLLVAVVPEFLEKSFRPVLLEILQLLVVQGAPPSPAIRKRAFIIEKIDNLYERDLQQGGI